MKTATCLIALLAVACAKESTTGSNGPAVEDSEPAPAPEAGKTVAPERGVKAPTEVMGADGTKSVAVSGAATLADTDEYTLSVQAPKQLGINESARVLFTVTPKPGWKLNEEFPPKLKINPPAGVEVDKPNQGKSDAVSYTTKQAQWAINVKPTSAGTKTVSGDLKFAVCTETTCNPRKPAVAFALEAK